MRNKAPIRAYSVVGALWFAAQVSGALAGPAEDCRAAAGLPEAGWAGIRYDDIDPGTAVPACQTAVAENPGDMASLARLGRALVRAGRSDEARGLLSAREDSDSAPLLAYLATFHRDGDGGPADPARAVELFDRAAKLGSGFAAYSLSLMLENGDGVAPDQARAYLALERAVELLYPPALVKKARQLRASSEPEDQRRAVELLLPAAEAGEPWAAPMLARAYRYGQGVTPDAKVALGWYRKEIARAPDDPAMAETWLQTGALLRKGGDGLPADAAAAAAAFDKAGRLGKPAAWWEIGDMARKGEGRPANSREAVRWFRKAQAAGDAYSAVELGRAYVSGAGTIKDFAEATRWFLIAAGSDLGVDARHASENVAYRFLYGFDNEANREEALRWFEKAAGDGDIEARRALGETLVEHADPERAKDGLRILTELAEQGDAAAQASLGYAYANGQATEADRERAALWYEKAAQGGNTRAALNLGELHEKGLLAKPEPESVLYWYRQAAEGDRSTASARLAVMLADSDDPAARTEALTHLLVAAKHRVMPAVELLAQAIDEPAHSLHALATGPDHAADTARLALQIGADYEEPENGCLAIATGCGPTGRRIDLAAAADWLRRAAPLAEADFRLARLLKARPALASAPDEATTVLARAAASGLPEARLLAALTGNETHAEAAAVFTATARGLPSGEVAKLAVMAATGRFGDNMIGAGWSHLRDATQAGDAAAAAAFLRVQLFYGAFEQAMATLSALPEDAKVDLSGADYTIEQLLTVWLAEVRNGLDPDPRLVASLHKLLPELARRGVAEAERLELMLEETELRAAERDTYVRPDIGVGRSLDERLADVDRRIDELGEGRGLAAPLVGLYRHRASLLAEAGDGNSAREALLKATALGIEINDQTQHLSGSLIHQMERACILRKTATAFYDMGDAATGLAFAKGAANALQSARQALIGLPQDMQGCFRDAIADQYRTLAGLMIEAGQLTEAQEILTQLADFETYRFWQEDSALAGQAFAPVPTRQTEAGLVERVAGLGLSDLAALRARLEAARAAEDETGARRLEEQLESAQEALAVSLDELGEALEAKLDTAPDGDARDAAGDLAADISSRSVRRLQGRLARVPGLAVVYSVTLPQRSHFLIVTGNGTEHVALDMPADDLVERAAAFRRALQAQGGDPIDVAQRFHRLIWAPVEAALETAGATDVLLTLDSPLRQLPIAALHDGKRWLLETRRYIAFMPAGQDLLLDKAELSLAEVEALGASEGGAGFSALPNVALELRAIVRGADGNSGTGEQGILPGRIRLNADFDEAGFGDALNGGAPVIHIASHFDLRDRDARSVLLLGNGSTLSMADLKSGIRKGRYDLANLEMLVLSACQTALDGSAGLESFAAAMHGEGVQSVLATLWPVPDRSTALFMQRFYRHLADGAGRAEALRLTQIDFLRSTGDALDSAYDRGAATLKEAAASGIAANSLTHPRAWAGFQLIGQWR